MTPEETRLARELTANRRWEWRDGVAHVRECHAGWSYRHKDNDAPRGRSFGDHIPDLSDPATRGCLLEMVREATGDAYTTVDHFCDGDWACGGEYAPTEGAALAKALLAAWGEDD